jgi:hypothetical protein
MNKSVQHKRLLQKVIILSLLLLLLNSCNQTKSTETQINSNNNNISKQSKLPIMQQDMQITKQHSSEHKMETGHIQLKGHIIFQPMEGGFYSFIANDGSKFTPMGLAKTYKQHGLAVQITAQKMHDVMTTMQFGTVIKILDVKVLDGFTVEK